MIPTIELLAVTATAMYGVLRGLRSGFDLVGLVSVAAAAAFGGGTLRDLLLDRRPLFWVEQEHLLWVVMGLSAVGAVAPRRVARVERLLVFPDAIGLGLFSIAGTAVAVESGMSPLVSIVMGVITGTFGGVICDVICNETPTLFRASPLCATCALLGAVIFLVCESQGLPNVIAQWSGVASAALLRVVSVRRNWVLPSRTLLMDG